MFNVYKEIHKEFEKVDSNHLSRYGTSKTGKVHIWSNYKGTALCGTVIKEDFEYNQAFDDYTCKKCNKINKLRYAVFDLAEFLFYVGITAAMVTAFPEIVNKINKEKNNNA